MDSTTGKIHTNIHAYTVYLIVYMYVQGSKDIQRYDRLYKRAPPRSPKLLQEELTRSSSNRILHLFETYGRQFTRMNLSTSILRAVKDVSSSREERDTLRGDVRFQQLMTLARSNLSGMGMQSLSHIAYAVTRLELPEGGPIMENLAGHLLPIPNSNFQSIDIVKLCLSISKAHKLYPELQSSRVVDEALSKLASVALDKVPSMTCTDMSSLAWAFASAGKAPEDLFDAMAVKVVDDRLFLKKFTPLQLSVLLWSYASTNHHSLTLFRSVGTHILKNAYVLQVNERERQLHTYVVMLTIY